MNKDLNKTNNVSEDVLPCQKQAARYWWQKGIREIAIVLALYMLYTLMQASIVRPVSMAIQNADKIIGLEKTLNIFHEINIQNWFLQNSILTHLANDVYSYLFYPAIVIFALWAYNRHCQQYILARNVFLVSTLIGLVCFALYPMAPPRLMPDLGFADTVQTEALHYSASIPHFLVNQYAAMPSFHFGWTLLVGVSLFAISRSRWLKAAGILLPLLMFISIVATGNHFILDAVGGALTILASYGIVLLVAQMYRRQKAHQPAKASNRV